MAVATPIPFVKATFFDRCGKVLAGGKVFTYEPRSTTQKATYNAPISGTPNTNPVILDAAGQADIYLYGRYRIIVQDANGVVVNDSEDIGSWYSGDLDSQLESVNQYLNDSGDALVASQQARIDDMVNTGLVGAGSTDLLVALPNGRTQRDKNKENINLCDYGADPTAAATSQPAFLSLINALPLNPESTLTPKGFANGGVLRLPRGRYLITEQILLKRGIRVVGESHESTQIISKSPNGVFRYEDNGGYIQDEIVFENLSIWQDASVVATSGAAIEINTGSYPTASVQIMLKNVLIEGTYDGIKLAAGVACSLENYNISKCVRDGIYLDRQGTSNTSTTLKNGYTHLNGRDGVRIEGSSYVSLMGLASDSNGGYGYKLDGANGFGIYACGAERNAMGAAYIKDTTSGVVQIHQVIQGGAVNGITFDNANGITLLSPNFLCDADNTGFAVQFVGTPKPLIVISPSFAGGFENRRYSNTDAVLTLNGNTGLVKGGDTNNWTFGAANAKDTTAQIAVVGNAEATTSIGTKNAVTFTAANATRNVATYAQVITANTEVTYPLVIGSYVPNTSKGAASTVQRAAGQYIAEQTAGATANANLMIDAGTGTVPAGQWSIYNGSTRANYHAGAMTWKPAATITPANNGDMTFELTSDTSLKIKVKGSDGIVRSATLTLS